MHTADHVTVTGTGYFGTSRQDVRQLTRQLGAQYSGDLIYGVTTHLVCKDSSLPDSEKLSVARAWGIPVVHHAWLLASLQQGTVCSEDRYCLAPKASAPPTLLPASVTLRAGRPNATHRDRSTTSPPHSSSADKNDVEVLRSHSSPVACQLADLLLGTPTSPTTGILHMQLFHHHLACNFLAAGSNRKAKHGSAVENDPNDSSPGMPPPSPISPPVSTPDFSSVAHSTSSVTGMSATSAVHRDIQCSSASGPPCLLTHSAPSKALDILEHSNSLLSPGSIDLSPLDHTSTSPDDPDCVSAFTASNAREPLPTTSNFSIACSSTGFSCAVHPTTDNISSRSSCESPEASADSPNQELEPEIIKSLPSVVKEALPRARSPAVEVVGLQPLKKAPRGNSVKQYHRLESLQGVVFYQTLEVTDEYGKRHCFDLRNRTQGALVYYEDLDNGDRSEAYCSLVHCYSLPAQGGLWVEHGYFDDREDLQSLPMGCKLMKSMNIGSHELVARPGLWHSSAQVIEGKFRLLPSQHEFVQWAERHGEGDGDADTFWCNKTWDPANGQLLTCHEQPQSSRKSCSLNSRYILA